MSDVGVAGLGTPDGSIAISKARAVASDFLERAGWTAGQQFFAVLLATSATANVIDLPWRLATVMAIGAALVSLITTAVQYLSKATKLSYWEDLGVRLLKTFLASLLASFGAEAVNVFEFDWAAALNLAALTTLAALAKGLLARGSGNADNPSTLAPGAYAESKGR